MTTMQLHRRLLALADGRLPRRTVRLRLTLLYGTLFLVSGALLLTIAYGLVYRATRDSPITVTLSDGRTVTVGVSEDNPPGGEPGDVLGGQFAVSGPGGLTPEAFYLSPGQVRKLASQQHAAQMRELLVQSGIAFGVMAVVSVVLGWIMAGRVLRPLRTITASARGLSATNLHKRLALDGPDDELKELGDTMDGLLDRLEAAFQSQRQFVANASHELRTPLTRQRILIQVALTDPDATAESLRATHERVLASGEEQEWLIEALLTLARGQAGLERRVSFDLATVTDQIIQARRDAGHGAVALHEELATAPVLGDPRLVERLVANLVDNAIRYNLPHGNVQVTTQTRSGHAVLCVSNTGPVVPPTALERLFQPFQRLSTDRTGRGDGVGLGLSIVKAIADAHGATINVHPRPEGGLEIEVSFPVLANGIVGTPAPPGHAHSTITGKANQCRPDGRMRVST